VATRSQLKRTTNEAAGLWHDVPRLDRPSRLWIIPADKATWLAAGMAPAAIAVNFDWRLIADPAVWVLALIGTLLGILGAYWQPERRNVARWAMAWVSFHGTPRRASWKPGRSPLAY
jgi:hypothetical protein